MHAASAPSRGGTQHQTSPPTAWAHTIRAMSSPKPKQGRPPGSARRSVRPPGAAVCPPQVPPSVSKCPQASTSVRMCPHWAFTAAPRPRAHPRGADPVPRGKPSHGVAGSARPLLDPQNDSPPAPTPTPTPAPAPREGGATPGSGVQGVHDLTGGGEGAARFPIVCIRTQERVE